MGNNWQTELYDDLVRRGRIAPGDDHPTLSAPHVERDPVPIPPPADAPQGAHPRCRIRVHSRLHRVGDIGGRSDKAAVDGLVDGGLLRDDGPEVVSEIAHSQERVRADQDEETVIEVVWGE